MSLIHWWPLNGDLQDKIQGKIFNNGGWTSASSGKIGTTYNANIGAILSASLSIPNTFSFACWVKNNDLTYPQAPLPMKFSNGAPYSTASTSNKGWEFSHGNNSKLTLNNGSTAQELNFGTPHVSYLGSWYHLVFTVDCHLKKASLFINGELKGEKSFTITDFSGTYTFSLGQIHGWKLDGFVNDIRIYDHVLSQAEVKELSKALVVHYTFNDVLAEPTTNIITGIKSAHGKSSLYGNGVKVDWSAGGADSYFMFNYSQAIKANSVYTLSFDCEGLKSGEVATFAVSNLSAASYNIALKNGRNSLTFTAGADLMNDINTHNRLFFDDKNQTNGAVFYLSNFQLEEKDHATPYTPSTRASMITDESGYDHPTVLVNNCEFVTDTNSGTLALHTAGADNTASFGACSYLRADMKTSITPTAFTVSMWAKVNTWGKQTSGVLSFNTGTDPIGYLTSTFVQYDWNFRLNNSASTAQSSIGSGIVTLDEWHHYAFTWDGANLKGYKDGTLYSTAAAAFVPDPFQYIFLGVDRAGGAVRDADVTWGSFKVYMTALSAEDVAIESKTRALVTDKGDIEAHQFIEDKTQAQVTSKYTFECKEIQEKLNIQGFELLDGILIEKNPYFDTGLVFGDINTSIYVDAEVTPTNTSGNNCLAGSGNSSWNGPIMLNFCGGKMEFGTSGYSTSTEPQGKFTANERLTVQAEIYLSTQKWYKNNVQIKNITQRTKTATTATFAIGTFKTPSGTVGASHSFKGYIHRFYVKYGDEVRCYLPAKRKSDNVCGLYDIHTKTFLVNSGGGTVSGTSSTLCDEAAIYQSGCISGREIIEL